MMVCTFSQFFMVLGVGASLGAVTAGIIAFGLWKVFK
jgi:hypothetical protein